MQSSNYLLFTFLRQKYNTLLEDSPSLQLRHPNSSRAVLSILKRQTTFLFTPKVLEHIPPPGLGLARSHHVAIWLVSSLYTQEVDCKRRDFVGIALFSTYPDGTWLVSQTLILKGKIGWNIGLTISSVKIRAFLSLFPSNYNILVSSIYHYFTYVTAFSTFKKKKTETSCCQTMKQQIESFWIE